MRAAVVTSFKEPLAIEDRPIPEPGPGQCGKQGQGFKTVEKVGVGFFTNV